MVKLTVIFEEDFLCYYTKSYLYNNKESLIRPDGKEIYFSYKDYYFCGQAEVFNLGYIQRSRKLSKYKRKIARFCRKIRL